MSEVKEIEHLRARIKSLEASHAEICSIALEAIADRSRLGRQVAELEADLARFPSCPRCQPPTNERQ